MDWDERLFGYLDDLEQEAESRFAVERAGELGDRARAEYATVTLAGRLLASVGRELTLDVRGVGAVAGPLRRVGPDWCLLGSGHRAWVVRLEHVTRVEGASERSVPEVARSPITRLGIRSVLRGLADSGDRCLMRTADGASYDVAVSRVGGDFVEVVTEQGTLVLLPFAGMAAVRAPIAS